MCVKLCFSGQGSCICLPMSSRNLIKHETKRGREREAKIRREVVIETLFLLVSFFLYYFFIVTFELLSQGSRTEVVVATLLFVHPFLGPFCSAGERQRVSGVLTAFRDLS